MPSSRATVFITEWMRDAAGRPTVPRTFSIESLQGDYRADGEVVTVEVVEAAKVAETAEAVEAAEE